MTYSSGVVNADYIEFQVIFDCMICNPVEGMLVECKTKTITKAGIHAVHTDKDGISPLTLFIARDHHNTNAYFNSIKEDTNITVKIIGLDTNWTTNIYVLLRLYRLKPCNVMKKRLRLRLQNR